MESKQQQYPLIQYKRTRIAPTPSGFLHLGNVLSFAITIALAQNTGTKILLRIDDLDQARVNKLYLQDIFDTLNFLEIPWDEGPRDVKDFKDNYSQLHRMSRYNEALKQLAYEGHVYACTCSRQSLSANTCACRDRHIPLTMENVSWRLVTDTSTDLVVKSFNGERIKAQLPIEMDNFVVRKKDGFPAYQLTSVIDDLFYGVDLVVRGEDLWPSTLAQHALAAMLEKNDFSDLTFYHHPLLKEVSGKKLSKSAGATSVKYLRESGLNPAQIYNLIAQALGINEDASTWHKLAQIVISDK